MEKSISLESGYSDSTSHISEPPDIRNWFSSYVYESFPLSSECKSPEKFVSNEDYNKPMNKNMRQISNESLISEPPDIRNWFSSYVYESPILDTNDGLELSLPGQSDCAKIESPRLFERQLVSSSTVNHFSESLSLLASDGLEFSALGESEYVKETETENEKAKIVCPSFFEQEIFSSAKVTGFSQSQSLLSESPHVRNWFSSYEHESPHEFGFSSPEKDPLIIDESDTEEEISAGIFRKAKSKQESIAPSWLQSNGCKENIAADTAKEISDNPYLDQDMKKLSSVELFDASTKELNQQSSFSPRIYHCNPKPQSPSRNEATLHELRPKHIQETISINSSRQKSPSKGAREACLEENMESTYQESDDKENVHGNSIETGFVTLKKARFREAIDRCSMTKPNRGILVECLSSKESKKIAREKDQDEEEERKKKRRVLGEMLNQHFPGAEAIAGKWRCPQKKKGKSVPPLKQLRLDAWIHKV